MGKAKTPGGPGAHHEAAYQATDPTKRGYRYYQSERIRKLADAIAPKPKDKGKDEDDKKKVPWDQRLKSRTAQTMEDAAE